MPPDEKDIQKYVLNTQRGSTQGVARRDALHRHRCSEAVSPTNMGHISLCSDAGASSVRVSRSPVWPCARLPFSPELSYLPPLTLTRHIGRSSSTQATNFPPLCLVAITSRVTRLEGSLSVRAPSRHAHVHPHQRSFAADWALRHLSRTIAASALVAAWHRSVRLGVDEADNARCLATDGRFGSLQPARSKMRVGERYHGCGRRSDRCGSASVG
eukprot:scaffold16712_cov65-Phaeocystis_antarctica.AAC.7